jgi:SAM-dependent methyltransferase
MSLTDRSTHFEFGANWRQYAKTVDRARIDSAVEGLRKLFPEGLHGKTFLDIGCGSGLHALAALSLGAESVLAIDVDENSVSTTSNMLTTYAPNANWRAEIISVLDATPESFGLFDVVYSWGVLHHTGHMWRAIERAAAMVKPGGDFAIAIYAKTAFDIPWKIEKRIYKSAPLAVQWLFRQLYMTAWLASHVGRGNNPIGVLRDYHLSRGMNFTHDAHDWLGGYPYETASVEQLRSFFLGLGFQEVRAFPLPKTIGLFGSGCHELVFRAYR